MREAQGRIDSHEFAEWQAYYSLEPFGGERLDIVMAQICAIVANVASSRGKRFKIEDFMLFTGNKDAGKITDPEKMKAYLHARYPEGVDQ